VEESEELSGLEGILALTWVSLAVMSLKRGNEKNTLVKYNRSGSHTHAVKFKAIDMCV